MIRAAAIACFLALPATAQEMTQESCRAGWQAFNRLTNQTATMTAAIPDVTAKGWCRVDSSNAELKANDFGSLEFRGTGIEQAVAQQGAPEALEVRIEGVDLIRGWKLPMPEQYAGPRGTLSFHYVTNPATRDITLKELEAGFGGLGHLKVWANGSGVDLNSLKSMQFTSGGLRIYDLTLQLQATPVLKQALVPPQVSELGAMVMEAAPQTSIDAESREALSAFLAAGPETAGLLRIEARSEIGLGFLQMAGAVNHFQTSDFSPPALTKGLSILLDGVTLKASWTAFN